MSQVRGAKASSRFAARQQGFSDKHLFITICLVALAAGVALWWFGQHRAATTAGSTGMTQKSAPQSKFQSLLVYPKPKAIVDFSLTEYNRDAAGAVTSVPFTPADLTGRWRMLFFGFSTCPDICPTTLTDLKALAKTLGPQMPELMFISIDPERDNPETLREYVDFFAPDIRTISSSDIPALTRFAAQIGAVFGKVPNTDPSSYSMDHSASLYLIDPSGALVGLIRPPHNMGFIAADLRAFLPTIAAPAITGITP